MLVFADESGDTGLKFGRGSSELMTVVLAIFADEEAARAADERIVALRSELRKPASFEFHFKENSDQIREAFLRAVAPLPFVLTGMVIDKTRLYTPEYTTHGSFYKDVCGWVFEHARPLLLEANVKIDKSGGQGFRRELAAYLKRKVNEPDAETRHIKQVIMQESRGDNLLQLADMLCGAIARSYRADKDSPDRFRKIVAHREKAVRYWPE